MATSTVVKMASRKFADTVQGCLSDVTARTTEQRGRLNTIDTSMFRGGEKNFKARPFGFDVYQAERRFHLQDEYVRGIEALASVTKAVQNECAKYSVPLIAILPSEAWIAMCKEAGLFRLIPNADGMVHVDRRKIDERISESWHTATWRSVSSKWMSHDEQRARRNLAYAQSLREAIIDFFSRGKLEIMKDLFPEQVSYSGENRGRDMFLARFPVPDADFGTALLQVKKMISSSYGVVEIVVDPEAVDVSDYQLRLLSAVENEIREHTKRVQEEAQKTREGRMQALRALFDPDPILAVQFTYTHSHGDGRDTEVKVHAIIAQYGKWPLEQEVVKQALENDFRMPIEE